MHPHPTPEEPAGLRRAWWREPEVAALIVLVAAAYFVRIGDVSLRGEEPTRAQVAFEMMRSGDWIVPRLQGDLFLSRPPLQNWLIAGCAAVTGSHAAWAVRLPSVLAMLFTTLLIYGYARTGLPRTGALAAAAAFATFGEMFTTGCQAETDMVFTALVSGSLLLWHWGQLAGWPAVRTWVLGYVFVALAVLCKGPQPPVYFFGAVSVYLVWSGQWRRLFSRAHLVGMLAGGTLVLAWLIPCVLQTSWPVARAILMNDSANRFQAWQTSEVAEHLLQFPLETLGCTLPWSLLLFAYASRRVRRLAAAVGPQALFTAIAAGLAFPTIWVPPGGNTRYYTPLYPCLAVLIGLVLDGCLRVDAPARVRRHWRRFALAAAGVMAAAGLAVILAALFLPNHPRHAAWAEPFTVALGYAGAVAGLAILMWRGSDAARGPWVKTAVLALAAFMVLTFTGYLTNVRIRRSEDQAAAVAQLKEQMPPGQRLVSFGHIDYLFAFYFEQPIQLRPMPAPQGEPGPDEDLWFCFDSCNGWRPDLPFAWREVAAVTMDRNRSDHPERAVVVGHRLPVVQASTAASASATAGNLNE
jgi:4-amino-4-deoxy-L-arabinose transferase-like glycosyltransferase